jgi:hypothetical protein
VLRPNGDGLSAEVVGAAPLVGRLHALAEEARGGGLDTALRGPHGEGGLDEPGFVALAERWRPWRTGVSVALRAAGPVRLDAEDAVDRSAGG